MFLSDACVRRPVLSIVLSLLLVIFGLLGLSRLTVREYPDFESPVVSVRTLYLGASPEVVESAVTDRLEEELAGIEGLRTLTSRSQEQISSITLEFELGRDIDAATQDVRDKVARAVGALPNEAETPEVTRQDVDSQAIIWLSMFSNNYSNLELSDLADRVVKNRFETLPGVGRVIIGGFREIAMRIWLDPTQMAARGITALDVRDALQAANVELPSGRIEGPTRELTVHTVGTLNTPQAFNQLIIRQTPSGPVTLADIGRAEVGPKSERSLVRYNGRPAVSFGIVKTSTANALSVARTVKQRLSEVEATLPPGVQMAVSYDSTENIEKSLEEVQESLWLTGLLVILVIYGFLRTWRATLIPALAIPVSLVGTFTVMAALGFSINILTLLALTLAIGLVVDDAIVVLENVVRHLEMGKTPFQAALDGTREIGFAILATTFSLVSVFLPLAFMTGTTGKLFYEFAISVAVAILISGFVSLTLAPALCGRLLRPRASTIHAEPGRMLAAFSRGVAACLGSRGGVALFAGGLMGLTVLVYQTLPSELFPQEDRSGIQTIIDGPDGATLAYTQRAIEQVEALFAKTPEIRKYFSILSIEGAGVGRVNSGFVFVSLYPPEERQRHQREVVASLMPQALSIPEANVILLNPQSGPVRGGNKPVQLILQGGDYPTLDAVSQTLMAKAKETLPGLQNLDTDLRLTKPELVVDIDRDRAAALGVSVKDMANTLQILLGGQEITEFKQNGKRYDVVVQAPLHTRQTPDQLTQLWVRGQSQQLIPLSDLVQVREVSVPKDLSHYSRERAVTISASLAPGTTLGQVVGPLEALAKEQLPAGMRFTWGGDVRELQQANATTLAMFALAVLVVFLVLAAQFESFIDPLIVLMTVPLAMAGAVFGLALTGNTLNIYSQIGLVLLVGLVTKNGILIVEYANQLQVEEGLTPTQAVQRAVAIRVRPILMTSLATVVGALPIALGLGSGAESRKALGLAVVAGMTLSTVLTLYVLPVFYSLLKRSRTVAQEAQAPHALKP
jgi:multidrug efflux pump